MKFCTFIRNSTQHTKLATQHSQFILCRHLFVSWRILFLESESSFLGTTFCRLNLFLLMIYTLTRTTDCKVLICLLWFILDLRCVEHCISPWVQNKATEDVTVSELQFEVLFSDINLKR